MPRPKRTAATTEAVQEAPRRARTRARAAKAAAVTAEEDEDEEEEVVEKAPVKRRGRRKAAVDTAAAAEEKAPANRRGRRKAAVAEDEEEEEQVETKKRGAPSGPRDEMLYVEQYAPVWDALDDGKDTRIGVNDDCLPPRGKVQKNVVEFVESRGRKKTTAQDVIDFLNDEGNVDANGIASHMINKGILAVV